MVNITIPQDIQRKLSSRRLTFRLSAEYERDRAELFHELCDWIEIDQYNIEDESDFVRAPISTVSEMLSAAMREGYHPVSTIPDVDEGEIVRVSNLSCEDFRESGDPGL